MTTTYGGFSASAKDKVRFWVADVGPTTWFNTDEDIEGVLDYFPNPLMCAAQIARQMASQFAQMVSKRVGDLSINYSDKSKQYLALAEELERQGSVSGLQPYAGGISHADRRLVDSNTDRVKPPFRRNQFDNRQGLNGTSQWDDWSPDEWPG